MNRIALITQAAPWEQNQLLGLYNWHQGAAVKRAGGEMEIFVPVASAPRVLERFSAGLRRLNARPDAYDFRGVGFHAFKGYIPHPVTARHHLAPRFPWTIGRWYASLASRVAGAMATLRPDVVMVHDGLILGMLGQRVAERMGATFAIIEHETIDFDPDSRAGHYYHEIGSTARAIFSAHEPSLAHMRDRLGLKQARQLLNGSVIASEAQLHAPRPAKWEGKKLVLCVGAFDPAKGHVELVKAFADANVENSVLMIVGGNGPARPAILAAIEEAKLTDRVEMLEPMSQEQLQQYMAWADLFALPSRWESFGLVFTEAMGARTPIICTNQCGVATHITPGVHGWVVPPLDHAALVAALREALLSADLEAMGRAGRKLVEEKFSWDTNARQLLAELE